MDTSHIHSEVIPEIVESYDGELNQDGDVPIRAVRTILVDEHGLTEQEAYDVTNVSGPNGIDIEVTNTGGVVLLG